MSSTESNSSEAGQRDPPPNPVRKSVVTVAVTLALLAALVWAIQPPRAGFKPAPLEPRTAGCPKVQHDFLPTNITELPDSPVESLPRAQKFRALLRTNMEPCSCGCNQSIAACRASEPACETSRKLAEKAASEAAVGGKPEAPR